MRVHQRVRQRRPPPVRQPQHLRHLRVPEPPHQSQQHVPVLLRVLDKQPGDTAPAAALADGEQVQRGRPVEPVEQLGKERGLQVRQPVVGRPPVPVERVLVHQRRTQRRARQAQAHDHPRLPVHQHVRQDPLSDDAQRQLVAQPPHEPHERVAMPRRVLGEHVGNRAAAAALVRAEYRDGRCGVHAVY